MNTPPTPRRSAGTRDTGTRRRLIEATRLLVREGGLAAATSRAIAEGAGANLAAITYHFGSKDALVAEVLYLELEHKVLPALDVLSTKGDPVAVMFGAISELISAYSRDRGNAPVYLEALVAASRPGEPAKAARRILRRVAKQLAARIVELQDGGVVPAWVEPAAMAALIVAVANGLALQLAIDPQGPSVAAMASQFGTLLAAAAS